MTKRILCLILGLPLLATGIWMVLDPASWYAAVPGVPSTGPLNPHFVRDIGAAYATAGGAISWAAFTGRAAVPLTVTGGAFLGLHALIHGGERLAGIHHGAHTLVPELVSVWLPAILALALAWWLFTRVKEIGHG